MAEAGELVWSAQGQLATRPTRQHHVRYDITLGRCPVGRQDGRSTANKTTWPSGLCRPPRCPPGNICNFNVDREGSAGSGCDAGNLCQSGAILRIMMREDLPTTSGTLIVDNIAVGSADWSAGGHERSAAGTNDTAASYPRYCCCCCCFCYV